MMNCTTMFEESNKRLEMMLKAETQAKIDDKKS
jgi:hypothetical protein